MNEDIVTEEKPKKQLSMTKNAIEMRERRARGWVAPSSGNKERYRFNARVTYWKKRGMSKEEAMKRALKLNPHVSKAARLPRNRKGQFGCPYCSFNAKRQNELTRHLRKNHPGQNGIVDARKPMREVINELDLSQRIVDAVATMIYRDMKGGAR